MYFFSISYKDSSEMGYPFCLYANIYKENKLEKYEIFKAF